MSVQAVPATDISSGPSPVVLTKSGMKTVNRYTGWNIGIAIVALSLGALIGILQGLEHAGLDLYPYLDAHYQDLLPGTYRCTAFSMHWSGRPFSSAAT